MQQAGKTNETGSCCLDTNIKRGRAFPGIPPRIIQWHGPVRLALRTSATNEKRAAGWGWGRRGESVQGQCGRVRGTALWMSGGGWGKRSWINESSVRRSCGSSCAKRKLDSQNDQLDLCIIAGRFFFHTRTQTHTHTHRRFSTDKMELDSALCPPWPDLRLRVGLHSRCTSHAAAWTRGQGQINFFLSQTSPLLSLTVSRTAAIQHTVDNPLAFVSPAV